MIIFFWGNNVKIKVISAYMAWIFLSMSEIRLKKMDRWVGVGVWWALSARARISNLVSGGQCHLNHLTILRRFSWPSLAYMCTKVA